MIIEIRGGDEEQLGKMVVRWDENAALMSIRSRLEEFLFQRLSNVSTQIGDETDLQRALDALSVKALALIEKHAAQAFHDARARLVSDVFFEVSDIAMGLIRIYEIDDAGNILDLQVGALDEERRKFKQVRKNISRSLKRIHNERIGIHRGSGKRGRDAKPRQKRAPSAATKRKKILTAMREIGQEPVKRKDVAPLLDVSVETLRGWLKEIGKEFGEEWDDLIAEALSTGR